MVAAGSLLWFCLWFCLPSPVGEGLRARSEAGRGCRHRCETASRVSVTPHDFAQTIGEKMEAVREAPWNFSANGSQRRYQIS
jgi:hypothetical protein